MDKKILFFVLLGTIVLLLVVLLLFLKRKRASTQGRTSKRLLNQEESLRYFARLSDYVGDRVPYLETSISLKDLAARMEVPLPYLNQAIEDHAKGDFDRFIAQYRIEKAMHLLQSPDYTSIEMKQIAFDAGFKEESLFNQAFKKKTGLSPKDYQRKYLQKGS